MFTLLLPISYVLLFLFLRKKGYFWRPSILISGIIWGLLVVAITEILSIFSALTFNWLVILWSIVDLIILSLYLLSSPTRKKNQQSPFIKLFIDNHLWFTSIFLIITMVGIIAFIAPPNTGDSLTYHMSRVEHWIQNRTINHYPTNTLRQLHLNPWAEFAILHFQILLGEDRLANFIQWFSMVGSIIGVTLIAKSLGASQKFQIVSSVIAVTIPMGILQGSSSQNDYVVSFWLVCFVYFFIKVWKSKEKMDLESSIYMGLSLGLAILTKGTSYIFAFPFIVWLFIAKMKLSKIIFIKTFGILLFLIIFINGGHYVRNYSFYGSPFGSLQEGPSDYKYANDIFTLQSLISNSIRNIGLHLGVSNNNLNLFTEKLIINLHKTIGFDINDSRTTWGGSDNSAPKFHITYLSTHEDTAGNFFHLLLIIISTGIILKSKYLRKKKIINYYLITLCLSFLSFSFLFRWQSYHSRLHLPIFVLWSPLVALALSVTSSKRYNLILIFLILTSLYWVLFNHTRPVIGKNNIFNITRTDQYFVHDFVFKDDFVQVISLLKTYKCNQLGIKMSSMEYPIWILMKENFTSFRIEHVEADRVLGHLFPEYPLGSFNPCALIYFNQSVDSVFVRNNFVYSQIYNRDGIKVFVKK